MNDKTGGAAFPGERVVYEAGYATPKRQPMPGMSLRDYFAAKALGGLCADPAMEGTKESDLAEECYSIADAMLKERAR